jgi:hypoxanthine phosphoribosyltransferase
MTVKTPDTQPFPDEASRREAATLQPDADEHLGHNAHSHDEEQRVPYKILRSLEDREEYLHLTDNLIRQMVEQETDVAVFLDKSARPVAWLMHALWDQLAPRKPDGSSYPEPAIKFLNIDREQWGAIVGDNETSRIDIKAIPQKRIDELKKVMAPVDELLDEKGPAPETSLLTGKKVMVIDEISASRATLNISEGILKRAFPDAAITATAWMDGQAELNPKSGQQTNTKNPVWYNERKVTGRGVGNRDTTRAAQSHSGRSRIGRYWLSTPFKEPDTEGIQLRKEMSQIARDLEQHRVLYRPSTWSPDIDPFEARIKRINNITLEQYKNLRITTARSSKERIRRLGQLVSQNAE